MDRQVEQLPQYTSLRPPNLQHCNDPQELESQINFAELVRLWIQESHECKMKELTQANSSPDWSHTISLGLCLSRSRTFNIEPAALFHNLPIAVP